MTNNFNINLYKKSQQNSNLTKTPHEVVRFLMENLLNSMKSLQSTFKLQKSDVENLTKQLALQSKNASKALTIIYSLQISLDLINPWNSSKLISNLWVLSVVWIITLKKTKTGLVKAIEVLNDILEVGQTLIWGKKMFENLKDQLIELERLSINISDLIKDNKYENIVELDEETYN